MNKGLIVAGLALFALSQNGKSQIMPTISLQEGAAIGELTLPMSSNLNDLMNKAKNQKDYERLLKINKEIASIQLSTVEQSGFMSFSDGFRNLANSLGIKL